MQTSRRRTVATTLRVAVSSGAAAVGWLVLGATGAQASEEIPALPAPDAATTISRTVADPALPWVGERPSTQQMVSDAPLSDATIAGPAGPSVAPGSPADIAAPVALSAVEETVSGAGAVAGPVTVTVTVELTTAADRTVASAPVVGETLAPGPLPRLVDNTVPAVLDTVQDVLAPAEPLVEQVVTAVEQSVPEVPGVEAALPAVPLINESLPVDTGIVPVAADVVVEVPVTDVPEQVGPARQAPVSAGTDPAAQAHPATPAADVPFHNGATAETGASASRLPAVTPARVEGPSPVEVLANRTPVPAGEAADAPDRAAAPFSLPPGTSSPSAGAALPGAGSTTSAGNGGGSGTSARGSGPDPWPGMPGGAHFLELFPQLTVADAAFFGDIEQPPGPPGVRSRIHS